MEMGRDKKSAGCDQHSAVKTKGGGSAEEGRLMALRGGWGMRKPVRGTWRSRWAVRVWS